MRVWNVIKGSFKGIMVQFPIIFLGCGLFPLILTLINSQGMSSHSIEPTIYIKIIDEDQTELSEQFRLFFESETFELVDEDATFLIIIPIDYEKNVLNHQSSTLQIEESGNASDLMKVMLTLAIEDFHQQLEETYLINHHGLMTNKEFMSQLNLINETSGVETKFTSLERDIAPFERWAVFATSLVFATSIINLGIGKYAIEEMSITTRIHMFPLTKAKMFHYELIESFILPFSFFMISLVMFATFSSQIRQHFINFIPMIIISSLFALFIAQLIYEFIPKKFSAAVFTSFMLLEYFISFTGIGLELFPQLSYFWPGMIIQHLYEGVMMDQWDEVKFYAVVILVFCLLVYGLIRLKIFTKWGRQ